MRKTRASSAAPLARRAALVAALLSFLALAIAHASGAEPGLAAAGAMPPLVGSPTTPDASYDAVWCTSTSSCAAVGPSTNGRPGTPVRPTAVTEASGTWGSPTAITLPAGASTAHYAQAHLNAVSCAAQGHCAAVGDYGIAAGGIGAMIAAETTGTWRAAVAVAQPTGGLAGSKAGTSLGGVWCDGAGSCIAVGTFATSGGGVPMVVTETSGVWSTASRLPLVGGLKAPHTYTVTGISCTSVASCTVVGDVTSSSNLAGVAFADREVAGSWGAPGRIPLGGAVTFTVSSVACPSATECIGVGEASYETKHQWAITERSHAAFAIERSGSWHATTRLPEPDLSPSTDEGALTSISCAGPVCEAVGATWDLHTSKTFPFAVTFSSGRWSSGGELGPIATSAGTAYLSSFTGVSCASSATCLSVGGAALNPWTDPPYTTDPIAPFSSAVTTTRLLAVPAAPRAPRATPGISVAVISWQPPSDDGGSPITSFTVTSSPGHRRCTTGMHECVVRGLLNDHAYSFTVTDSTSFATSQPSLSTPRVRVGVPTPPTGIHLEVGRGFVDLSWRASTTPAGETVLAYAASFHGHRGQRLACSTASLACRIRGFAAGAEYAGSVMARDVSGWSRPSLRVAFIAK